MVAARQVERSAERHLVHRARRAARVRSRIGRDRVVEGVGCDVRYGENAVELSEAEALYQHLVAVAQPVARLRQRRGRAAARYRAAGELRECSVARALGDDGRVGLGQCHDSPPYGQP